MNKPSYKIILTKPLEGDLYAQFTGLFLNDNSVNVECGKMYGGTEKIQISRMDKIRINLDAVKVIPRIGVAVNVDGILSVYAQNPQQGALLSVTKVY